MQSLGAWPQLQEPVAGSNSGRWAGEVVEGAEAAGTAAAAAGFVADTAADMESGAVWVWQEINKVWRKEIRYGKRE